MGERLRDPGTGEVIELIDGKWVLLPAAQPAPAPMAPSAVNAVAPSDPAAIQADKARHRHKRLTTQPIGKRSAGCVFKNPAGHSAGKLIDDAGLKGMRIGGAAVSDVHANFLINAGNATTADFLAVIEKIQETVSARFGLDLATEIQFWKSGGEEAAA